MEEIKQKEAQDERKEENSDSDYSLITTSSEDKDSTHDDDKKTKQFPTNEDILTYISSLSDSKIKPKFYEEELEFSDEEDKRKMTGFKDDGHVSDPNWKKITGEFVKKMSYRKPTVKEIKMRLSIFLQDHKSTQNTDQPKPPSKSS